MLKIDIMKGLKILIVDDSVLSRNVLSKQFQNDGAEVVQVTTGAEAILLLQETIFDCAYIDYEMPEMNGLELIQKIQKMKLNPRPALTLLTAHSSEDVYQLAIDAGADAYITKGQSVYFPTVHVTDLVKKLEAERAISEEVDRQIISTESSSMQGLKVLIVDDSLLSRKILTRALEQEEAKVTQASSGAEALILLKKEIFDCVYVDFEMPGMSGSELMAKVHALKLSPRPALAMITAHDTDDVYKRAMEAGADVFLSKGQSVQFPTIHVFDLIEKIEAERLLSEEVEHRKMMEIDLLKAKEKAETSTQAKSDFLASMSHEIRTPMNGILGMAQILQKSQLDSSQQEQLEMLISSGDALLGVLNDILDFSKIEAGKLNIESVPFDLHQCLEETCDLLLSNVNRKNLELIHHIMPGVPAHVLGDPGRVRQVLINYISNAVKFTRDGHILIQVEASRQDGNIVWIKYSVIDTGIGIPKDKQRIIFDKFSQADSSTTREFGGTGLGLSICQQLTHLMKGEVGLESVEGKGSTFWFEIPMSLGKIESHLSVSKPGTELKGCRLLYVDSNQINQKVFKEHFFETGAEVKFCSTAIEAFKALDQSLKAGQVYDVLVSEHHMQKHSGLNLIESIHKRYPDLNLRSIMLTCTPEKGQGEQMKHAGFHAYLPKPARRKVLKKMVKTLLDTSDNQLSSTFLTRHSIKELEDPLTVKGELQKKINKKILIAEDNLINQKVAINILEKFGAEVDVACDGQVALDMFLSSDYDLILMDCMMPKLDGYEATRAIRDSDHPRAKEISIVAMTAHSIGGNRDICLESGMNDYISKPFKSDSLREIIEKWIR